MFGFGILSGADLPAARRRRLHPASRGDDEATCATSRWAALWTTIVVFALSLVAWGRFDIANAGFQLVEQKNWLGQGLTYKLGVDGMSFPFVVLTAFLMPFCIARVLGFDHDARARIHDRLPRARDA